jgi:sulfatase modifying factor 1
MSRIFILFFVIISCKSSIEKNVSELNTKGMVFIEGGEFLMGADNEMAMRDEYPQHLVKVNSFWMDESEVTVADFKKFVDATGYLTTAERAIDWDDLKQYLPLDTPKPHDSLLAPSSLVFNEIKTDNLNDFSQWWSLEKNVNWKRPHGKDIDINLILKHPVTHVSWDDAVAYCKWIGKRLPTEAEFEFALRAGKSNTLYTWGNEGIDEGKIKLNIWQGDFPSKNTVDDEYYYTSPVKSFEKNSYGLHDISGNVWEWCSDWYHSEYYSMISNQIADNPKGPNKSYDPSDPYSSKKVMRGGSFLCNESYCMGYRNSMRMKNTPDSSSQHVGFRTVLDID